MTVIERGGTKGTKGVGVGGVGDGSPTGSTKNVGTHVFVCRRVAKLRVSVHVHVCAFSLPTVV